MSSPKILKGTLDTRIEAAFTWLNAAAQLQRQDPKDPKDPKDPEDPKDPKDQKKTENPPFPGGIEFWMTSAANIPQVYRVLRKPFLQLAGSGAFGVNVGISAPKT